MKTLSPLLRWYLGLTLFAVAGTVVSFSTGVSAGFFPSLLSLVLNLCGFFLISRNFETSRVAMVWVLGLTAELIGLRTGLVFGSYEYTGAWWPSVGTFPIMLPFAWVTLVGLGTLCARNVVLGAAAATLVDFFMEAVMVDRFGYWRWLTPGSLPGGAPIHNALGWFFVSLIGAFILTHRQKPKPEKCINEAFIHFAAYGILMITAFFFPISIGK